MKWFSVYRLFCVALVLLLFQCSPSKEDQESLYLNVKDPKASYVGMQECKVCHASIYESFMRTGMGQSWGLATKEKSAADFSPSKALVYDPSLDLYYKPYWKQDSLYIKEFRLAGKDTVHAREEYVHYIVGSGQHTNSHIIETNGYLHQAPITFYTQKGTWDLAPGFEKGHNSRFDRKIEPECITCHNGNSTWVEGSLNKYSAVPLGIDCERCHGPGSLHVANKKNAIIVDTSKEIDYSIVNPKKLSTELQNNLCQRCHLQGITVVNKNKTFYDFRPSERLSKTMNTFMPVYSEDQNHMIMASHVERMKQSACYVVSQKMSCITCHNPHVSVKETPATQFISACKNCHANSNSCKASQTEQARKNFNCITCHMPKNGSIDIPHVAVTDHRIQIPTKEKGNSATKQVAQFIQMQCYNNEQPSLNTRAKSFLEFYERYVSNPMFLDSALRYLGQAGIKSDEVNEDIIRVYYLQEKYPAICALGEKATPQSIRDAWTNYRIGEAYSKMKNFSKASLFLEQACKQMPYALDFQLKLGDVYLELMQTAKAKQIFDFILRENPSYGMAWFNLGYLADQENQLAVAETNYLKSLHFNPDHVQSLINLSVVYYKTNRKEKIKPLVLHALKLDPQHAQLKAMLQSL